MPTSRPSASRTEMQRLNVEIESLAGKLFVYQALLVPVVRASDSHVRSRCSKILASLDRARFGRGKHYRKAVLEEARLLLDALEAPIEGV